jgi:hypothetical protein
MKPDRILVGFDNRNPTDRNPTNSLQEPTQNIEIRQDPIQR